MEKRINHFATLLGHGSEVSRSTEACQLKTGVGAKQKSMMRNGIANKVVTSHVNFFKNSSYNIVTQQ